MKNSTRRIFTGLTLVFLAAITILPANAALFRIIISLGFIIAGLELVDRYALWPLASVVVEYLILITAIFFYSFTSPQPATIIFLILSTCSYDTVAYSVGRRIGHRFIKTSPAPNLSPNKSWEGCIAGAVASIAVGILYTNILALMDIPIPSAMAPMVYLGCVFAQLGDLAASAAKRALGLKDSGQTLKHSRGFRHIEKLMDGMGGYLDRLDSLALTSSVFFLISLFT